MMKLTERIHPLLNPLRERWKNLSARDQRILRLGATVLLPVVAVIGIALPLSDHLARLEKQARVQSTQLTELRALKATQPNRSTAAPATNAAPQGTALAERLRADLQALVPGYQGTVTPIDQGIDLQIEKAPLNALLDWLGQTQRREALFPVDVRLRADTATPGLTSGRIRLQTEAAP